MATQNVLIIQRNASKPNDSTVFIISNSKQIFTAAGSLSGSPVNDNFAFERIAFPNDVCVHVNIVHITVH